MLASEFPFYALSNEEFLKETGAWVHDSASALLESRDLFKDIIASPEKTDDHDCNESLVSEFIESNYHSVKQCGRWFFDIRNKGLSMLHFNIRSLKKNLTFLNDILMSVKELPNIIAISETKLSDNNPFNTSIPGYSFLSVNSKTSAGGVGFYVSENVNFKRRNDLDLGLREGLENCWIEIERKKQKNIVIGCIYRHPSQNRECFHEAMKSKLETLNNEGCEVYITGDINIDFFQYNTNNQTSEYLDMLLSLGYLPIITRPTRITDHSATLIDHIYTNVPQKLVKSGICLVGITDHLPIFCTVDNKLPTCNERKYFRDFSSFKDELFINDLNNLNFSNLVSSDVNQSMNNILKALTKITDKHAPLKKISNSQKRLLKKSWISKCLLVSIKKRHKLFKSHFLSKDPEKIKQYLIYNNKLNKLKERAKKNYFTAKFNLNKNNIKATWGLIGMLINMKKNSSTSINQLFCNNRIYTDKRDICEHLNSHFIKVGPRLAAQIGDYSNFNPIQYITRPFSNSFIFRAINAQEVKDLMQNLKSNKASIDIPNKCVKLAVDHISEALTKVFNCSLVQGIMPDVLKVSRVTLIDKGGDAADPSNYRPISTLYLFAQIFETLVYLQVSTYLEKYSILNKFQFCFRKGRSTEQAIVEITDNLKKVIDNNLYTCGVFLNFAKAFDTVNHQILLKKIETYGIRGIPLKWFTSYLFNRQQYVSLSSVESSKQTMKCVIPQGSSLGPLLFLL